MAEKYFKFLLFGLFGFSVLIFFAGMGSDNDRNYRVNVTQMVSAGDGLDLKAVGELLKKADNAEQFETLLNDSSNGVNNLDLNEDGKVDYINVTEFGDEKVKGFSLTTSPAAGETQELATIKIEKDAEGSAKVETKGNENVYGRNNYYHSSWSPGLGTGLMMGYLFSSHSMFSSPYGYGYYPRGYRSYSPTDSGRYRNRMNNYSSKGNYSRSNSSRFGSSVRSPNSGKVASSIKAPLKDPTSSQKSFQSRNPSKQVRSGGFGRRSYKSSSGYSRSNSVRSFGRSGGFFRGK